MGKKPLILIIILFFLSIGCSKNETPYGASVKDGVGFFTFSGTLSSSYLPGALEYFTDKNIKKVIMEIHSGGGSLYEMWRIISLMEDYSDIEYETRVYGIAGSAGFLVYLAGDIRLISRHPTFVWHRAQGGLTGEILELFTGRSNAYIASRTGLTVEQIQEKIESAGGDWYFGAKEAIALGIAHGYIE